MKLCGGVTAVGSVVCGGMSAVGCTLLFLLKMFRKTFLF
jgi:hypothetical protein